MSEILTIKNINKSYPTFSLKNVSFDIKLGRITGFIGRNGAGKTTTLKCIYGLLSLESGDIFYNGHNIKDYELEMKNEVGLLFGGVDFYPNQKVKTLTSIYRKFFTKWDEAQYQKFLKYFDIDENKRLKQLSNGMRVKYGLAIALSHHAKVLLLDEPTSGLDPVSRDELLDLFMKIVAKGDTAILFSTHVISDLEKCSDDIVYIKQGEIVEYSSNADFKAKYLHVDGLVNDLTEDQKDKLEYLSVHKNNFIGLIKKENESFFNGFNISEAGLEEIMLSIERGNENEESPL